MTYQKNSNDLEPGAEQEDEAGLDLHEERDTEQDTIQTPFDPTSVDIADRKFTISALLERLKHDELKLTPDFQRRANLWDETRKSRLIESVLLRIPLPSFYFSEDKDGSFEVVDGLQRLCSIFHFVDFEGLNKATGVEPKLNPLRLKGLQYLKDMDDKSFSELERPFQRRINELEINVNVIRATTPKAVMFNVFARLNQGGLPLSAQEIRNAIYPGLWRDHIRNLARIPVFLKATEGRVPTDRQQDMEMVLRFIALWSLAPSFQREPNQVLDKFLNDTVEHRLSSWDSKTWSEAEKSFKKGLKAAMDIYERHAFRKSYGTNNRLPINKGVFEAQLITLAELPRTKLAKLIEQRQALAKKFGIEISDPRSKLNAALRSGTGHAESSNTRINELRRLINEVLDD